MILSLLLPALAGCSSSSDARVEALVKGMTLKEKVCQMFILRPESLVCPQDPLSVQVTELSGDMAAFFKDFPAGGFCLYAHNIVSPQQLLQFTSDLHALPMRPLLCVDEEGGRVVRIAGNAAFGLENIQDMTSLAADGDARKVREAAGYIGGYVGKYGFDVDFAPVADVNTNPQNPIIGTRAFSGDPKLAAGMVVSYLDGLRDAGVTGCIKHFPGHGDTTTDTHTGYAASGRTWAELEECEMLTFKAGIAAGVEMIMTAHIAVPKVTGLDIPATMSSVILQDKLRGELGYRGIIVTDALAMGAVTQKYTPDRAAVETVKAGADIILLPADYKRAVEGLLKAVESGEISESRIDESVRRIISLKMRKGLVPQP